MAGRGSKPGERRGGRAKGTPNKATAKCRETIALIADEMSEDFKAWLLLTASGDEERGLKPDPKGAADLYLKAIEYHIPKLGRTVVAGDPDSPLKASLEVSFVSKD